jgi:hypothetical protein
LVKALRANYAAFVAEPRVLWTEAAVDSSSEHIRLCFGDASTTVALVAPAGIGGYTVEFVLDHADGDDAMEALRQARQELDLYLDELNEPDPWAYAIHHCGTASNVYSSIRWEHHGPARGGADA